MVGVVHAEELLEENRVSKEKEEQDAEVVRMERKTK